MDLTILARQHKEIKELIVELKEIVAKNKVEEDSKEIASKINMLAGKLKVHLSTEDKYMYPYLLKSENDIVRKKAVKYSEEMGDISQKFINYKDRFNTRSKINGQVEGFVSESNAIFKVLEERMLKEDTSLYIHI